MKITAEGREIRAALGFQKTAGYTHYWYLQKRDDGTYGFTTSEWSRVKGAANQIIKKAIADGILLGGPMGSGRPKVTSDHIALNGVGPESHESFFLQRNDEPKSYQRPQDGAFSFTKTNHKPYDPVVVSILAAAQKLAPDAIKVDSDGGRGAIKRIYAQETTMKITAEGQQIREALGFQKTAGKFDLGRMVQTRGIDHASRENREFGREVQNALRKYVRGDWGKSKDKRMNDQAVKNGDDRIMGVYPTDEGDIWIITEWDRSATTILFPNEY